MKFIFEIKIKKGHSVKQYADAWKKGSKIIQSQKGAQGTILYHKIGDQKNLIAIASWKSKKTRDAAMRRLDKTGVKVREVLDKHNKYGATKHLGNFEESARVKGRD